MVIDRICDAWTAAQLCEASTSLGASLVPSAEARPWMLRWLLARSPSHKQTIPQSFYTGQSLVRARDEYRCRAALKSRIAVLLFLMAVRDLAHGSADDSALTLRPCYSVFQRQFVPGSLLVLFQPLEQATRELLQANRLSQEVVHASGKTVIPVFVRGRGC